jgi:hypothetical protein
MSRFSFLLFSIAIGSLATFSSQNMTTEQKKEFKQQYSPSVIRTQNKIKIFLGIASVVLLAQAIGKPSIKNIAIAATSTGLTCGAIKYPDIIIGYSPLWEEQAH